MNFTKSECSRAEALHARGLDDEKLISLIIDHERTHGTEPKRLRAEMYDKMNHTCRKYTDRMIRMRFDYDFTLDTEVFKKVMLCFFEKTPVFHSAFKSNFFNPYWRVMDYRIDEAIETVEKPDVEAEQSKSRMFSPWYARPEGICLWLSVYTEMTRTKKSLKDCLI